MRKTKVVAQQMASLPNSEGMNIMLNYLEMERQLKIRDLQIQESQRMLHNIRTYSMIYTPIKDGITDVLRVLKGRSL
jgi:hypothetical protein